MNNRTGEAYHVRLELARERGYPAGDRERGYDLAVPLNHDEHIDATSWCDDPSDCTVRRFRPGEVDALGTLSRTAHGRWYFDYHSGHDAERHQGIRLGDEHFVPGAFVGINEEDGCTHTFRVVSAKHIERV